MPALALTAGEATRLVPRIRIPIVVAVGLVLLGSWAVIFGRDEELRRAVPAILPAITLVLLALTLRGRDGRPEPAAA